MASDAKTRLVDLLDRKAFQPVLDVKEDSVSEPDRDKLRHVKRATESERKRFQSYGSAREVYDMYKDDLTSANAKKVDRELKALGLPTLRDVQSEFEKPARSQGVVD